MGLGVLGVKGARRGASPHGPLGPLACPVGENRGALRFMCRQTTKSESRRIKSLHMKKRQIKLKKTKKNVSSHSQESIHRKIQTIQTINKK